MKYGTAAWYATWIQLVYGLDLAESTETWRLVCQPTGTDETLVSARK